MDISGQHVPRNTSSFTDNVTLNFLTNPSYQTGLAKKIPDNMLANKNEFKFYRKRVLALTKILFKEEPPSQSIKKAHDEYVNVIIEYFKMTDKSEILQNEYDGNDFKKIDDDLPSSYDMSIEEANNVIMNKPAVTSNLDSFVNTKQIKIDKQMPPPKKKQINLHNRELKIKGLKKRIKKE